MESIFDIRQKKANIESATARPFGILGILSHSDRYKRNSGQRMIQDESQQVKYVQVGIFTHIQFRTAKLYLIKATELNEEGSTVEWA